MVYATAREGNSGRDPNLRPLQNSETVLVSAGEAPLDGATTGLKISISQRIGERGWFWVWLGEEEGALQNLLKRDS